MGLKINDKHIFRLYFVRAVFIAKCIYIKKAFSMRAIFRNRKFNFTYIELVSQTLYKVEIVGADMHNVITC